MLEKRLATHQVWDVSVIRDRWALDNQEDLCVIVNTGTLKMEVGSAITVEGNIFSLVCQKLIKASLSNEQQSDKGAQAYDIGILPTPFSVDFSREGPLDGCDGSDGQTGRPGKDAIEASVAGSILGLKVLNDYGYDGHGALGEAGTPGEAGQNGRNGGACKIAEITVRNIKAVQEIHGGLVKKYKSSTGYDQKAVLQAVDPKTGEVLGHTTFVRQIEADEHKFAKLSLSHFSAFFDLKTQAIKIFGYILNQLKPSQDMVIFFMDDCLSYTGYKTKKPVYEGLAQLLAAEIIARGSADNLYFINPLIAFNGNRITFAKSYINSKKNKQLTERIES